jgi:hypothetical protein
VSDADTTPHPFADANENGPFLVRDTCKHCGNGQSHPVHAATDRRPILDQIINARQQMDDHSHPGADPDLDVFCLNQAAFIGERITPVLDYIRSLEERLAAIEVAKPTIDHKLLVTVAHFLRDPDAALADTTAALYAAGQIDRLRFDLSLTFPQTEAEETVLGFIRSNHLDVHTYFGLTYSNYLVLHRTLLQSMPDAWQDRFTQLMQEIDHCITVAGLEVPAVCTVHWRDDQKRFVADPIPHYNKGRTKIGELSDAAIALGVS